MPLFNRELNELADRIGRTNLTIWLHTAAPTEGTPTNARISAGGGTYEIGATLLSSNISSASNGDIENSVAVDFGEATEDVGTVTHWSAIRGTDAVAFGTLPNTTINNGDSFEIDANSMQFNGSST